MAPIYDKEAYDFAAQLYNVFRAAGSKLPDDMVKRNCGKAAARSAGRIPWRALS